MWKPASNHLAGCEQPPGLFAGVISRHGRRRSRRNQARPADGLANHRGRRSRARRRTAFAGCGRIGFWPFGSADVFCWLVEHEIHIPCISLRSCTTPRQRIPMSTTADTATVNLEATVGGCKLKMSVSVPMGPTRIDDLLPLLQIVSNHIVETSEREVEQQGKCISCRKGCGACCRQLVPVSPVDARNIARLVSEMPQPRKT